MHTNIYTHKYIQKPLRYTHTHTHTNIYIYIYVGIRLPDDPLR